jgi:outer membrane protein assembly factor BamB
MKRRFPILFILCCVSLLGASFLAPPGEQLWRFITGGRIRSWPAVGNNSVIYSISEDRYLYALNKEGKQLWRLDLEERVSDCFAIGYDGTLYVGLKKGVILAINPRGIPIWRYDIKSEIKYAPAMNSDGTLMFITQQGELLAVSHTGLLRWKQRLDLTPAESPVTDAEGTIYIPLSEEQLLSLYPWGQEKWRLSLRGIPCTPAIARDGTLIVGTDQGLLYAIGEDGQILWNLVFASAVRSPVIDSGGNIYGGLAGGRLFRTSKAGKLEWTVRVGGNVSPSCALGKSGTVYVSANNNYLYAFSAGGAVLWSLPVKGKLTHPVLSSEGTLYVGSSDWSLYAFRAEIPGDSAWPQYRHDFLHSGRSGRIIDTLSVNERYGQNPDFLYFKNLLLSKDPRLMEKGLAEIRRRYDNFILKADRVYLFYLLGRVAGGSIVEENRGFSYPTDGYSTIRAQACNLYTVIGGFYARDLLLRLVRYEKDTSMKAAAIHCLGMLQSDPQGEAVHGIAALLFSLGQDTSANSVAREGIAALENIGRYHGSLPPEGIKILLAIAGGNYLDNIKQQATAVLKAIY